MFPTPGSDSGPLISRRLQSSLSYPFAVGNNSDVNLFSLGPRKKPYPTKKVLPATLALVVNLDIQRVTYGDGLMPISCFYQPEF